MKQRLSKTLNICWKERIIFVIETNFAFPDFKPIETVIEEKELEIEEKKLKNEIAGQVDLDFHLEAETESGKKYWDASVENNR